MFTVPTNFMHNIAEDTYEVNSSETQQFTWSKYSNVEATTTDSVSYM
jgi:hypothetical protein